MDIIPNKGRASRFWCIIQCIFSGLGLKCKWTWRLPVHNLQFLYPVTGIYFDQNLLYLAFFFIFLPIYINLPIHSKSSLCIGVINRQTGCSLKITRGFRVVAVLPTVKSNNDDVDDDNDGGGGGVFGPVSPLASSRVQSALFDVSFLTLSDRVVLFFVTGVIVIVSFCFICERKEEFRCTCGPAKRFGFLLLHELLLLELY